METTYPCVAMYNPSIHMCSARYRFALEVLRVSYGPERMRRAGSRVSVVFIQGHGDIATQHRSNQASCLRAVYMGLSAGLRGKRTTRSGCHMHLLALELPLVDYTT